MNTNENLLIEIGTEELPTNDLKNATDAFKNILKLNFHKEKLDFLQINGFATIRRLSFLITSIKTHSKKENIHSKIKNIINASVKNAKFKINMRWSSNRNTFIRPVRWYVLILGNSLINHSLFGIKSTFYTYGHKSLTKQIKININNYHTILEKKGFVITSYKKREHIILKKITQICNKHSLNVLIDIEKFKNIINSLEYPSVLISNFKKKYLNIPRNFIISTITKQDCLPIEYKNKIINKFIIITDSLIKRPNNIINGYTYSINTKLSDAENLYKSEKNFLNTKKIKDLKNIIFHEKLGNMYDKTKRIIKLVTFINTSLIKKIPTIKKAAILLKMDLLTKTIAEIPELSGVITAYSLKNHPDIAQHLYAYNATLNNKVLLSQPGAILAIADKIDNISSFFSINKKATSSKDPFNLRRDALIIIKSIIKNNININIKALIEYALKLNKSQNSMLVNNILELFSNRLSFYYKNENLIFFNQKDNLSKLNKLILTKNNLFKYKIINELIIINKRIHKITQKNKINLTTKFNTQLLQKNYEKIFFKKIKTEIKTINILNRKKLYFEGIKTMLNLKKYIEDYFKNITIINNDTIIKQNNLKLLNIVKKIFTQNINLNVLT